MDILYEILNSINCKDIFGNDEDEYGTPYVLVYKYELLNIAREIKRKIEHKYYTNEELEILLKDLFIDCFGDTINHQNYIYKKIINNIFSSIN